MRLSGHVAVAVFVGFAGACGSAGNSAVRASGILQDSQIRMSQRRANFQRELAATRSELLGAFPSGDAKGLGLIEQFDRMTTEAVAFAGSEARCSTGEVNEFVRRGLRDLSAWWSGGGSPPAPRPFVCNVPTFVDPGKIGDQFPPVLSVRGSNLGTTGQLYFVIDDRAGNAITVDRSTRAAYWSQTSAFSVSLNLSQLFNEGLISCDTIKISLMWKPAGWAQGQDIERLSETLLACKP